MSIPINVTTATNYNYLVFIGSCDISFNVRIDCSCLMVGGGGGGGNYQGGGGGAGGVFLYDISFQPNQIYNINIGYGGLTSMNGGNTTIKSGGSLLTDKYNGKTIAYGGGYGGSYLGSQTILAYSSDISNSSIGSGGGGCAFYIWGVSNAQGNDNTASQAGGITTSFQGFNGGYGSYPIGGGGGGGSGSKGNNAQYYSTYYSGGNGGNGTNTYSSIINDVGNSINNIISGWTTATSNTYIAGGGSGGTYQYTGNYYSTPGLGGGGQGAYWIYYGQTVDTISYPANSVVKNASNGFRNTGGGGGGGSDGSCTNGGNGGSGIIILRINKSTSYTYTVNPISSSGTGAITGSSLSLTGYLNSYSATNQNYINSITNSNSITSSTFSGNLVSLNASYGISSGTGFTINSDQRIKKNIEPLSSTDSLQIIKALEPSKYQYVDFFKGTVSKYGYLAQKVESVLPSVVNQNTSYIPNFFEIVKIENLTKIILDTKNTEPLEIGTKLKFYDIQNNIYLREVQEIINEKSFTVNTCFLEETDTLFLYGQEVNDYLSIDMDQINTILLSALQEFNNELEYRENEISTLKNKIEDTTT